MQSQLDTASVPAVQGLGRLQRLLQRLAGIRIHLKQGENGTLSNGSGNQMMPPARVEAEVQPVERSETAVILNRKLAKRWKDTAGEAGRPEGRVVKALVLGEQRYPDPSVWGPDTETSLTQDEEYRKALAFLRRVEETPERD